MLFPDAIAQHVTNAGTTIAMTKAPNGFGLTVYRKPNLHVLPTVSDEATARNAYRMLINEIRSMEAA